MENPNTTSLEQQLSDEIGHTAGAFADLIDAVAEWAEVVR